MARFFAILVAFLILCGLGTWQLQRLAWKEGLIAHMQARTTAPPLIITAAPPEDLDYRRVQLSGTYLPTTYFMPAKVYEGKVGFYVLNILNSPSGFWVINRGWAPSKEVPVPESLVTITGIARLPPAPGPFTPANDPARNDWFSYDLPALAAPHPPQPYVLEVDKTTDTPPLGGITRLYLPNNHLHYALTWFSLAAVLLVISFLRFRK